MLTKDKLLKVEGLTEQQAEAIAQMSEIDENTVMGQKISSLHTQYDDDVFAITGKRKPPEVKTYEFLKTLLADVGKVDELNTKITTLETQLAEAGKGQSDDARVAALEAEKATLETTLNDVRTAYADAKTKHEQKLATMAMEQSTEKAKGLILSKVNELGLRKDLPQETIDAIIQVQVDKVLAKGRPEVVDDKVYLIGEGDQRLTSEDKLSFLDASKLVVDAVKGAKLVAGGENGGAGGGGAGAGSSITLEGAKTQHEARKVIHESLAARNLATDSIEYQAEMDKAYAENNISALPLK